MTVLSPLIREHSPLVWSGKLNLHRHNRKFKDICALQTMRARLSEEHRDLRGRLIEADGRRSTLKVAQYPAVLRILLLISRGYRIGIVAYLS